MKDAINIYQSKDFYSCCVLRTLGFKLLNVEQHRSGVSIFIFEDPNNTAENQLISFWNRELLVEPRAFIEAIQELKTRIYSK